MITSIAAIAGAITALIGVGYAVVAAIKNNSAKKEAKDIQQIGSTLKNNKLSDEEREKLQRALTDIANS